MQPTELSRSRRANGLSPVGEATARLKFDWTPQLTVYVGCDAFYQANVVVAGDPIDLNTLPDLGEGGIQQRHLRYVSGVTGLEWRH